MDWHFLTWITFLASDFLQYLCSSPCSKMISERLLSDRLNLKQSSLRFWMNFCHLDLRSGQKHFTFLASDFLQYLWFYNRWRELPATFITCICDQKHFCISCLFSPHKFLAALNSVWNIKPVSSEHSIKCWRIQLLQVYKIVWWLCLQCMAKDNYSWQERGLERCPTLKPCQGCRIKE